MLLTIIACILIADLITGVVHWWEDSYGSPTWPLVGKRVIEANIDHHLRPGIIGSMTTVFSRNAQTVVPAIVTAVAVAVYWPAVAWPVALTLLLAAFGNEVHAWNHRSGAKNNRLIRFLQDAALIQTPAQHARHHRAPFDRYYCTLTNVTNACLEAVNFWRALEWLIATCFGVKHRRCSPERQGV